MDRNLPETGLPAPSVLGSLFSHVPPPGRMWGLGMPAKRRPCNPRPHREIQPGSGLEKFAGWPLNVAGWHILSQTPSFGEGVTMDFLGDGGVGAGPAPWPWAGAPAAAAGQRSTAWA